jgi:hypothetical protein
MGAWVSEPEDIEEREAQAEREDTYYDFCEDLDEKGLECHPMGDEYATGLSFYSMKEDETRGQFRQRVADLILEITGEKVEPKIIQEAYYG